MTHESSEMMTQDPEETGLLSLSSMKNGQPWGTGLHKKYDLMLIKRGGNSVESGFSDSSQLLCSSSFTFRAGHLSHGSLERRRANVIEQYF